jgi:hypothetical protein
LLLILFLIRIFILIPMVLGLRPCPVTGDRIRGKMKIRIKNVVSGNRTVP